MLFFGKYNDVLSVKHVYRAVPGRVILFKTMDVCHNIPLQRLFQRKIRGFVCVFPEHGNAQHPCCRTACTADQKASPFHAPSFSTAFTGQMRRQLPQCRQWAASILRGTSGLMQPTGQTPLVHSRKNRRIDIML